LAQGTRSGDALCAALFYATLFHAPSTRRPPGHPHSISGPRPTGPPERPRELLAAK
jgi:hypothetical protein